MQREIKELPAQDSQGKVAELNFEAMQSSSSV